MNFIDYNDLMSDPSDNYYIDEDETDQGQRFVSKILSEVDPFFLHRKPVYMIDPGNKFSRKPTYYESNMSQNDSDKKQTTDWAYANRQTIQDLKNIGKMPVHEENMIDEYIKKIDAAKQPVMVTPPMAIPQPVMPPNMAPQYTIPQPESSFTGGAKVGLNRAINDYNYGLGMIEQAVELENERQNAFRQYIPQVPSLNQLNDAQLNAEIKRLNRNIMSQAPLERNSILRAEVLSPVIESHTYAPSPQELQADRHRLMALQQIQQDRLARRNTAETQNLMRDYIEKGGSGSARMRDARMANNLLPETKGWGTVGEIVPGLGQAVVPIIAGAISGPVGTALGGANILGWTGQNIAQTEMEMDNYEDATGTTIPANERRGYTLSSAALNTAIDAGLQGKYLKKVLVPSGYVPKEISRIRTLIPNAGTQLERRLAEVMPKNASNIIRNTANDAFEHTATGTMGAMTQDGLSNIYRTPENMRTLEDIRSTGINALAPNAITGAALGGISNTARHNILNNLHKERGYTIVGHTDIPPHSFKILNVDKNTGNYNILLENGNVTQLPPKSIFEFYPMRNKDLEYIEKNKTEILKPQKVEFNIPEPPAKNTPQEQSNAEILFLNTNKMNEHMKATGIYPPKESVKKIVGNKTDDMYRDIYQSLSPAEKAGLKVNTKLPESEQIQEALRGYVSQLPYGTIDNNSWNKINEVFNKYIPQSKGNQPTFSQPDVKYMLWQDLNGVANAVTLDEITQRALEHQKLKQRLYGTGEWITNPQSK